MTREAIKIGVAPFVTKDFTYDQVGNRLRMSVDAKSTAGVEHEIGYEYDPLNRLTAVVNGGNRTTYEYDLSSNVTGMQYPNQVKTKYVYDEANRLLKLRNERQPSGVALSSFEYTYDAMNNRQSMRDIVGLHQYGYDRLYRLTSVDYPTYPDQAYGYDPAGNRLTQTITGEPQRVYTYNVTNALQDIQTGTTSYWYSWDAAGNISNKTMEVGGQSEQTTYVFDGANRLTGATLSSGQVIAYGYDVGGQRVVRTTDGDTTWFVFDGLSVVIELDADKKPTTVLVPGVSKTRLDLAPPLTEFYVFDGLGSVAQLTDSLGNPTQEYQYDVFGSTQNVKADNFNRYRFVGLAHDDALGLTYMNARWYGALSGRFVSRDPRAGVLDDTQTQNYYVYARNNPVNTTDITGLGFWSDLWSSVESFIEDPEAAYSSGQDSSVSVEVAETSRTSEDDVEGALEEMAQEDATQTSDFPPATAEIAAAEASTEKAGGRGRVPDFYAYNVNIAIPNPYTSTYLGWTGQVVVDRYRKLYIAPLGFCIGKAMHGVSHSVTAGWIGQKPTPSPERLRSFLSGHSISVGGGYRGGGFLMWVPGKGKALQVGYVTPQGGASYSYSIPLSRLDKE